MRRLLLTLAVVVAVVVAAPAAVAAPAPVPTSMGAIGDSLSLGFNACGGSGSCLDVSWSTGAGTDHPDFASHYTRLAAIEPGLVGQVVNAAVPGSPVAAIAGQVATLAPNAPDYVTILIGGADVCKPSIDLMTPVDEFRASFREGLAALREQIPAARVLAVSIPDVVSILDAVRERPGIESSFFASYCASVYANPYSDAKADRHRRAAARRRIERFNSAIAAECARDRLCRTDRGALFRHRWIDAEVSADFLHPSITGQQMMADVTFAAGWRWAP